MLSYDPKESKYVPVIGAKVVLRESGLATVTDRTGRYLFRELAAGSYTIAVENETQTLTRKVKLGSEPVDPINVDLQIGRAGAAMTTHGHMTVYGRLGQGLSDNSDCPFGCFVVGRLEILHPPAIGPSHALVTSTDIGIKGEMKCSD